MRPALRGGVPCVRPQSEDKRGFCSKAQSLRIKAEAYRWVMPHLTLPPTDQPTWVQSWDEFKRQKLKILKQSKAATNYATEFTRLAAPANGTLCLALFFWRAGGILIVQGNCRAF